MFWLKSKHISEAINQVADKIEKQIDIKEIVEDVTNSLKRAIVEIILRDCGIGRFVYNRNQNGNELRRMVNDELKIHAQQIAEQVRMRHEAKILKNLDSKEIQKLVEEGIKEKVKDTLSGYTHHKKWTPY